jgi:hypothetical protein
MTDEVEPFHTERTDHTIKIENIIREMIVTTGAHPITIAVTAAVRRDDPERSSELALERSDEGTPTTCLIQEAVDQDQRVSTRVSPLQIVDAEPTDIDKLFVGLAHVG